MTKQPSIKKLCIHTITTKPWSIEQAADKYAAAGLRGITVWRNALEDRDINHVKDMLQIRDLKVVSLCRGGFFPAETEFERQKAIDENRRILDEAAALGAPHVVLVCGAVPGLPLDESRQQIRKGIEAVIPHAEDVNVKLAVEPLHPMYADTRSAINTLRQANEMAEAIQSPMVGVAVDVYHLWWDPELREQIRRCGQRGNLLAFHISDWKTPTNDLLLDRGLMGEGCINVPQIRQWVEETGFDGYNEVEIFSSRYWGEDQDTFLQKIIDAYLTAS